MQGLPTGHPGRHGVTRADWFTAIAVGVALAAVIWWPLAAGGGLVGGDTYPYFFPQKQVMAESFARGEIPLWHDRTGLGYPLLAESQAGVFYPFNQVLYRLLTVNDAYNAGILLHYVLAFVFAWRFVRTQAVSQLSGLLAAMIFVYGWFPVRISLEWSIIGGVWFPAALWLTERLIERPCRRRFAVLAACLAVHLLAGHFTLAFITQLSCLAWAMLQLLTQPERDVRVTLMRVSLVAGAAGVALLLSAVQLLPTMELKRLSQREDGHSAFDPAYGHLPPVYLTQLVASWWYWHSPEIVRSGSLSSHLPLSISADTNPVEAHFYLGLIPLGLLATLANPAIRRRVRRSTLLTWSVLSLGAIVYATGWLIPVTRHIPGFGYFMGPARYTIIAAMGGSILTGQVLDGLLRRKSATVRTMMTAVIFGITLFDLLKSSEYPVRDAVAVPAPPIARLADSWVAETLAEAGAENVRLLSPGPNVANLYGVSCVPQYLGLGPAEYYTDQKTYRTQPDGGDAGEFPTDDELRRLRERGVTHVLATEPIVRLSTALEIVQSGPDAFLNSVWSRGSSPCFLYRFHDQPSRVFLSESAERPDFSWVSRSSREVCFQISLRESAVVGLRELMYPGWTVSIDGVPALPEAEHGFARLVAVAAGSHRVCWSFEPSSFRTGAAVSVCSLVLLVICTIKRRRQKSL